VYVWRHVREDIREKSKSKINFDINDVMISNESYKLLHLAYEYVFLDNMTEGGKS
jgi:hypothetical protein